MVKFLRMMSLLSGAFGLVVCLLLIVTYIQLKRTDPLNTTALISMNRQLAHDPGNTQLQQEIRQVDLLARRAFFTSQWQIRTGGYLLITSLLILVICLKSLELIRSKIPQIPVSGPENFWLRRKTERRYIVIAGLSLVVVSLSLAWLTLRMVAAPEQESAAGKKSTGDSVAPQEAKGAPATTDTSGSKTAATATGSATADGFPTEAEIRANFPGFRGPGGNGIAFQKSIPASWDGASGKNIRWKTEVPLPGYNSPVIWGDKIFLSGAKEGKKAVYCFDAASGKILWTTDLSAIPGSPGAAPKVIAETGQAAPTMTTDGRRVYAIFANGDLAALDFDGKIVWSKNFGLPKNHYGHSSSLIMYHDLLIVQYDQSGAGKVMALAGKTGQAVWETARNVKISWSSPVLVNTGTRMELLLDAEPMVASYDPATGKELWKVECISGEVGPSLAYADKMVFSVNEYSKLAAIKLGDTPSQAWENDEYLSDVPSPVAVNDLVFVVTSYGVVACYDAKSGEKNWFKETEKSVYASPMVADGRLFVLDKQGTMHIFRVGKTLTPAGEASLGEGSCCTPAFTNGHIFIRGNKHLFCIGN